MNPRYRRVAPPLPNPDTLPFPANLIRKCQDCWLHKTALAPTPDENIEPHDVFFCAQNPGREEEIWGRPLIGQSGIFFDSLLFRANLPRESVSIGNLVHCRTPNNRELQVPEIRACSHWLDLEVEIVNPYIIVAMGAPAIRHFLGSGAGTVEHLHGKPVPKNGRIILPAYHPAAALRETNLIRQCQEDFDVLRGLVNGRDWQEYIIEDEYPNPDYRLVDTPAKCAKMRDEINKAGIVAVDTEICRGKLWSVQFSSHPGTAWFVLAESGLLPLAPDGRIDLSIFDAQIVVHNFLFDVRYLNIPEDRFVDSMVCAYLTGQPQGLKELAYRLSGVQMQTYKEVVRPAQHKLSLDYLRNASQREWPDPPQTEETKWNNKKGELVTRMKKPWHISRKINKMLSDLEADDTTDLWDRWRNIPKEERAVVEDDLGAMPESSLVDVPFQQAVAYGSKDSDVTLRVYYKLKKLIEEANLDFVLGMDLDILPIVFDMMKNGMPVDVEYFRRLSEDYDLRKRVKAAELAGAVGHSFNPASASQVAAVVYGELGFKPTGYTPTGLVSTDDQELKKTGHPVAKGVIEYRRLDKMQGTYADNIVKHALPEPDGHYRIHTTIKTTRTDVGRLASADPINLQNQPVRGKEAKAIRLGYKAPSGWLLGEADLGQIEMRTQAHLAVCKGLIDLFLRGDDPHTITASRIFGVPYDEAKRDKYRYPCKRAGFGVIFLMGEQGLADQIAEYIADLEMEGETVDVEPWDVVTCKKFITEYYKLYPEIKDYQHAQAAQARRYGWVADMFGRRKYIPEVSCPIRSVQESGLKMAAHMPVSATAQGIIKLAMSRLWQEYHKDGWEDRLLWLMQVHDSLVVQMRDDQDNIQRCFKWIGRALTGTVSLLIPITADYKVGSSWGEMEKVKLS